VKTTLWVTILTLVVVFCLATPAAFTAEKPAKAEVKSAEADSFLDYLFPDAVNYMPEWFDWGADIRLRQAYFRNAIDFDSTGHDTWHYFRLRTRAWIKLGPFFTDPNVKQKNGLWFYTRVTSEPRFFLDAIDRDSVGRDEAVFDALYFEWKRICGLPISFKGGRQDMIYGRGLVMLDGTPLDGSTTIYQDAAKLTVHLDPWKTNIDFFGINNKGDQDRVDPLWDSNELTSEFDTKAFGVYVINKAVKNQQFHGYYIYKDEDDFARGYLGDRVVQTLGGLAMGKLCDRWDYYIEGAYQWGQDDGREIDAGALAGEVGYTFKETPWTPRVFGAYTYLTGDDPDTSNRYEGWDTVFARWPQWSELFVYRTAAEQRGEIGNYTNLHRIAFGVDCKPTKKMVWTTDFNLLFSDDNSYGTAPPYNTGSGRGYLVNSVLKYKFNKWLSGHLLAEYFIPGSFYDDDADEAFFLRWQLEVKLK